MLVNAAISDASSANERTTLTPARLARTRSLMAPIASWLSRVRAKSLVENDRVTSISAGIVRSAASVSLFEMWSITYRALVNAKIEPTTFSRPKPRRRRTCVEVVRRPAHDVAGRHLAEEGRPELVQAREQDRPELVLDVAARREDGDPREHAHDRGAHADREHDERRLRGLVRLRLHGGVDGVLDQEISPGHEELLRSEQRRARQVERKLVAELCAEADGVG